jgi:CRISPR-associated endonuclease Cas1
MELHKTVAQRVPLRKSDTETPQPKEANNPERIVPKHGVVTLFGYGINIRVNRGHLILEDGIADERREGRLARVAHGLERLVVVGNDGSVSLAALRWLADQKASFVFLERDGTVLLTTGPARSSDARLRRAQARADESGLALAIVRELIRQKIVGQEQIVRQILRNPTLADGIAAYGARLPDTSDIDAIRLLEAHAAQVYWSVWKDLPVIFPKSELPRVPEHWRTFGLRKSPLTGKSRLAATPPNAILNYCYAVLESEARLAVAAMGLDPGLGFLHVDEPWRDSLACDVMEPIRPHVDRWVLDWITRKPLKREWFFEQRDGNCRLMASLTAQLAETAPLWRHALGPLVEWVVNTLWSSSAKSTWKPPVATRLTRRLNREAAGGPSLPESANFSQQQNFCRTCGTQIKSRAKYCPACAVVLAKENLAKVRDKGTEATHRPTAQAVRSETRKREYAERKAWDAASLPSWLTEQVYWKKVQPLLNDVSPSVLATKVGLAWDYAAKVRKGRKLPHRRHWLKLAELVGVSTAES